MAIVEKKREECCEECERECENCGYMSGALKWVKWGLCGLVKVSEVYGASFVRECVIVREEECVMGGLREWEKERV